VSPVTRHHPHDRNHEEKDAGGRPCDQRRDEADRRQEADEEDGEEAVASREGGGADRGEYPARDSDARLRRTGEENSERDKEQKESQKEADQAEIAQPVLPSGRSGKVVQVSDDVIV